MSSGVLTTASSLFCQSVDLSIRREGALLTLFERSVLEVDEHFFAVFPAARSANQPRMVHIAYDGYVEALSTVPIYTNAYNEAFSAQVPIYTNTYDEAFSAIPRYTNAYDEAFSTVPLYINDSHIANNYVDDFYNSLLDTEMPASYSHPQAWDNPHDWLYDGADSSYNAFVSSFAEAGTVSSPYEESDSLTSMEASMPYFPDLASPREPVSPALSRASSPPLPMPGWQFIEEYHSSHGSLDMPISCKSPSQHEVGVHQHERRHSNAHLFSPQDHRSPSRSPGPQVEQGPGSPSSSVEQSPVLQAKPAQEKPLLACLFCRGRKIACGSPILLNENKTCNQCYRRSLKCEYPSESRRGMRKTSKPKLQLRNANTSGSKDKGSKSVKRSERSKRSKPKL